LSLLPAGAVNESVAHGLGGSRKEMRAILKRRILSADQPQPGFMHKRGRLECLAGSLLSHFDSSQPAQFLVNEAEQFFGCLGTSLLDGS